MTPLAAVLALALAAGPSASPRRTGQDVSNAARAKAGLLPRKAAGTRAAVRAGYSVIRAPSPTFLPEPAPLADDPAGAAAEGGLADAARDETPAAPPARGAERRAALLEVVPVVAVVAEPAASPPEEPVAVRAPEPIGEPDRGRVAARGPTVTRALRGSAGPPDAVDTIDAAGDDRVLATALPPAPDGLGAVRASAEGVVTELTLSLRFDP